MVSSSSNRGLFFSSFPSVDFNNSSIPKGKNPSQLAKFVTILY